MYFQSAHHNSSSPADHRSRLESGAKSSQSCMAQRDADTECKPVHRNREARHEEARRNERRIADLAGSFTALRKEQQKDAERERKRTAWTEALKIRRHCEADGIDKRS